MKATSIATRRATRAPLHFSHQANALFLLKIERLHHNGVCNRVIFGVIHHVRDGIFIKERTKKYPEDFFRVSDCINNGQTSVRSRRRVRLFYLFVAFGFNVSAIFTAS